MTDKKDLAPAAKGGALATTFDYGADSGAGFESTSGADLSIPFLGILQSNSPQVEDNNPDGSRAGMLINTVTNELIDGDKGVAFLPVHKESAYVEWVPREKGGGFVAVHDPHGDVVKAAIAANGGNRIGKLSLPNGNDLVETHYVYGLMLDADGASTAGFGVIAFKSTQIKPYRDWLTSMYTLKGRPPMFANRAVIKTVKQKNEKGSFYNFAISPLVANSWSGSLINPAQQGDLLAEAKGFRDMVVGGMARAAFETQQQGGGAGAGDDDPEKPPF
jgi:hypothetical protein